MLFIIYGISFGSSNTAERLVQRFFSEFFGVAEKVEPNCQLTGVLPLIISPQRDCIMPMIFCKMRHIKLGC
jgi:hypothetical protein